MIERRISILVAAVAGFLLSAMLWHLFVRPPRARQGGVPPPPPPPVANPAAGTPAAPRDSAALPRPAADTRAPAAAVPVDPRLARTSYLVLIARSGARRRTRPSPGLTYLNDTVAEGQD